MSKNRIKETAGSFAGAPEIGARRRATTAAFGGAEEYVRSPVWVRPDQVAVNPRNPRDEVDSEDLSELAESMRELGQIQPATVMTRGAYLAVLPEHESMIDAAEYVVISGSRRLMAAPQAGLDTFLIHVNDALPTREAILACALVENIQRRDISPLAEARAVKDLSEVFGSQKAAAKMLGKSTGWVSQRLALLDLTPELKRKVASGELPVRDARALGNKPAEEQVAEWERRKEKAKKSAPGVSADEASERDTALEPTPAPEVDDSQSQKKPVPPLPDSPSQEEQPVQLMLDLEWEPITAATEIVTAYGRERAEKLAAAILDQL